MPDSNLDISRTQRVLKKNSLFVVSEQAEKHLTRRGKYRDLPPPPPPQIADLAFFM